MNKYIIIVSLISMISALKASTDTPMALDPQGRAIQSVVSNNSTPDYKTLRKDLFYAVMLLDDNYHKSLSELLNMSEQPMYRDLSAAQQFNQTIKQTEQQLKQNVQEILQILHSYPYPQEPDQTTVYRIRTVYNQSIELYQQRMKATNSFTDSFMAIDPLNRRAQILAQDNSTITYSSLTAGLQYLVTLIDDNYFRRISGFLDLSEQTQHTNLPAAQHFNYTIQHTEKKLKENIHVIKQFLYDHPKAASQAAVDRMTVVSLQTTALYGQQGNALNSFDKAKTSADKTQAQ